MSVNKVASLYNQALLSWLKVKLVSPVLVDTDLEYALKEIILFNGYFSGNLDGCIENIKHAFNGKDSDEWHNKICILPGRSRNQFIQSNNMAILFSSGAGAAHWIQFKEIILFLSGWAGSRARKLFTRSLSPDFGPAD